LGEKTGSFALNLTKKEEKLECRLTRSPVKIFRACRTIDIGSSTGFFDALEPRVHKRRTHQALIVGIDYGKCRRIKPPLG
jgi:hypothetical protein